MLPAPLRALLALLLPAECSLCGRPLRWGENALCDKCLALAFAAPPPPLRGLPFLPVVYSACSWNEASRLLVRSFKYSFRPRLIEQLRPLIAAALTDELPVIDAVVPVPLYPTRRRERGYNQAELLGRLVAAGLNAPLLTGSVRRRRPTRSQTNLNRAQRRRNVAGAFALRRGATLNGLNLLLVDDVLTTGATLTEIASLLPGCRVLAWTLVRREIGSGGDIGLT